MLHGHRISSVTSSVIAARRWPWRPRRTAPRLRDRGNVPSRAGGRPFRPPRRILHAYDTALRAICANRRMPSAQPWSWRAARTIRQPAQVGRPRCRGADVPARGRAERRAHLDEVDAGDVEAVAIGLRHEHRIARRRQRRMDGDHAAVPIELRTVVQQLERVRRRRESHARDRRERGPRLLDRHQRAILDARVIGWPAARCRHRPRRPSRRGAAARGRRRRRARAARSAGSTRAPGRAARRCRSRGRCSRRSTGARSAGGAMPRPFASTTFRDARSCQNSVAESTWNTNGSVAGRFMMPSWMPVSGSVTNRIGERRMAVLQEVVAIVLARVDVRVGEADVDEHAIGAGDGRDDAVEHAAMRFVLVEPEVDEVAKEPAGLGGAGRVDAADAPGERVRARRRSRNGGTTRRRASPHARGP